MNVGIVVATSDDDGLSEVHGVGAALLKLGWLLVAGPCTVGGRGTSPACEARPPTFPSRKKPGRSSPLSPRKKESLLLSVKLRQFVNAVLVHFLTRCRSPRNNKGLS
jgi:hypothetical protein